MAGKIEEISTIDLINKIIEIIGNPNTQNIVLHFSENKKDILQLTDLAKKIDVPAKDTNKAIEPLTKLKILRKSTGKKQFISWNHDSQEGEILLALFQPVKTVDEFFDSLARYCDVFLTKVPSKGMDFGDYLQKKKTIEEKKLRLAKAQTAINEEKLKLQKDRQRLKVKEREVHKLKDELEAELKTTKESETLPIKKSPYSKLAKITKIKSLFKSEPEPPEPGDGKDNLGKPAVIKPEVETVPRIGEAVAMQLPDVQECGVCQGEIEPGETFIKCSCELQTHVGCVIYEKICPQCGRELDLELILPEGEKKKITARKPAIRKEEKREIEEMMQPTTSYFAYIPEVTKESKIKDFLNSYYGAWKMGKTRRTKKVADIDLFITIKAAKKMLNHCYDQGREKEVMGLILGETYQYEKNMYSIVKDVVTSDLDSTEVNVRFENFDKLFNTLDKLEYDYQIIGWYHSHPGHTCFMSHTDVDTQERMFKHSYQRSIVIDPIELDMKAFALDYDKKKKVRESGYAIIDFKD